MYPRILTLVASIAVGICFATSAYAVVLHAPVKAVVDGSTLTLASGDIVRLSGIDAPQKQARDALASLVSTQPVTVESSTRDRYGRITGDVTTSQGKWLQGELVARGLAVVHPLPDSDAASIRKLLALEQKARIAKRGLWALPEYAPIPQEEARRHIGEYRLVEGVVYDVAERRTTTYLNFSPDWKSDFTLMIDGKDRRAFDEMDVDRLKGKRVRARGWIHPKGGPMIDLMTPLQLEVLH